MIKRSYEPFMSDQMKEILLNLYNFPCEISLYDYLQIFCGANRNNLQGTPLYISVARSFRRLLKRNLIEKSKHYGNTVYYGISPRGISVIALDI